MITIARMKSPFPSEPEPPPDEELSDEDDVEEPDVPTGCAA
jgi:hypothetical protein